MPQFELSPGVSMFYRDDDLTDPWEPSETALLLHGNAESGRAWNRWMPYIGRKFRIIRPDMRGFGDSTPMPADYPYTADGVIADFLRLMDHLGIQRFHVIAAKVGGVIAMRFAATHPERIKTLTVLGSPAQGRWRTADASEDRSEDPVAWARRTMTGRLGSDCPPEMIEGWINYMGRSATSTLTAMRKTILAGTVRDDIPNIKVPTLVVCTSGGKDGHSVNDIKQWQATIADSELLVFPSDSFHIAVTSPEETARATLDFIERQHVTA